VGKAGDNIVSKAQYLKSALPTRISSSRQNVYADLGCGREDNGGQRGMQMGVARTRALAALPTLRDLERLV